MLRIGEFASLNKVSVKTLRYYDEVGLLKPAHIDEQTGYRYYSAQQLPQLHRILMLRDFGFSLQQIATLLGSGQADRIVLAMLEQRAGEIEDAIRSEQDQLSRIRALMGGIRSGFGQAPGALEVLVKEVPALPVLSLRDTLSDYGQQGRLWEELVGYAQRYGMAIGTAIALYGHTAEEGERLAVDAYDPNDKADDEADDVSDGVPIEVALPLGEPVPPENGRIRVRQLPAVSEMACVIQRGGHAELRQAYASLQDWMERGSYRPSGPAREIHHVGFKETLDVSEHLTEVQIPLSRPEAH
ncbi:MerR family transcriptional regulator [Cohnella nanjingensis]|uniref:MerR family transcriptional regulator n=1 Tax=Cohnella nanjingensis TaxID=1387779 RepID=A0A7X0RMN9_9BACL|nr:MerR family transcriptional regulator [Cohnella nanjingensis]MBB6670191.1 MerR family transcriptional regulator [Cohnella nanjingensis]